MRGELRFDFLGSWWAGVPCVFMGKVLMAVISLAALAYLAHMALNRNPGSLEEKEASAPKRQLDNVREKAKQIEVNDQRYVDETMKNSQSP